MRFKKQKPILGFLLGAGSYYLLDTLRGTLPDNVDVLKAGHPQYRVRAC